MSDRGDGGSARRLAIWAGFLVVPLILGALLLPRIVRSLRGGATTGGAAAAPQGGLAALAGGLASGQGQAEPARRPPDGPTTEQIEAARAAELELARAQAGWKKTQTIAPREPTRDAAGELTSPFQGFGLSVESTPEGARVVVDGRDLGETPLVTTVACRPGEAVAVLVERKGWRPHRQSVRCRADTLLTLPVELKR